MTTKPGDDLTGLFFDSVKKTFAYLQSWGKVVVSAGADDHIKIQIQTTYEHDHD